MRRRVDPEDGLMEVAELWGASTSDDLHRVLVLHPPLRRSADAHEPFALLAKHHETEPTASAATAALLLTDRRWRDGVGHLARRIASSDILDRDQLDLLARSFLAADDAVYWAVPDDWFSDEGIAIDFGDGGSAADPDDAAPDGPAVARREVAPPLRRWASEWEVRRDSSAWSSVLARASELDARSAAAIVAGLLDAIECLDEPVQELLITAAVRWPHQAVRRSALSLIAERDGPEAAAAIGKDDPNARVRTWAASLVNPVARPRAAGTRARRGTPAVDSGEPPRMF